MKKAIAIFTILSVLIFTGCKKGESVKIISNSFTALTKIKQNGCEYNFKYKFSNCGDFEFISVNQPVEIDFSFCDGVYTLKNSTIQTKVSENQINNSPIFIVNNAINSSKNLEIMPDYNGNFTYYGVCDYGEYKLKLNEKGLPLELNLNNIGLTATFSEAKYDT